MVLESSYLSAEINLHGAELSSLRSKEREYIWQADPRFWKRHAPILFPIVGKVWDNTYRVGQAEYHLPQHGFARDCDFSLINQQLGEAVLELTHTDELLSRYPYPFRLEARHKLLADTVVSKWTVANVADLDMYYQIGAHPAFNLPGFRPDDDVHGYLVFYRDSQALTSLSVTQLSDRGHALPSRYELALDHQMLAITPTLFEHDALVLEGSQADRVVMLDAQQRPYLQMDFDAPVVGVWSPLNAPFCCIEPWFGRTDAEGFAGSIEARDYIQRLGAHETFCFTYTIKILNND